MLMCQEYMNSFKVSLGGLSRVKFHYSDFVSSVLIFMPAVWVLPPGFSIPRFHFFLTAC